MNKTLKYALGAVLGLTLAAPAFAQAPDVPARHWAYDAVQSLWNKVLYGYPDGLYRGNRPANRYELAAALKKLWDVFNAKANGLEDQIAALEDMIKKVPTGTAGKDHSAEIAQINQALSSLRNDVNALKGMQGDLNTLKRLTSELEAELATHGVNINAMKKDMADLDARLRAVEDRQMPVSIGGEINFLMLGGHETDGEFGLMPNYRITGVGRGSYAGAPVGASRDLTGLHELALNISDNNDDDNVDWGATMVVGNMFDTLGGFDGAVFLGAPYSEGNNDLYINTMWAKFSSSVFGKGLDVTAGRIGTKVGRYTWQRPDYTLEYSNPRWDNGEWYLDGANLEFGFGSVDLSVWGGRMTNVDTLDDQGLNNDVAGIVPMDNVLGFTLEAALGRSGNIRGTYIIQDSNTRVAFGPDFVNRLNTAGVDVDFKFGSIDFWGSYAMTTLSENTDKTFDDDNTAWDVNLGYSTDKWGIHGGLRNIEANYLGNGYWGRVGTMFNPTNVEGYNAILWFKPNDRLKLWAKGEMLEGQDNGGILVVWPGQLVQDDEVTSLKFGADFKFSDMWGMMLGYETVDFDYNVGPDVDQKWWSIGFKYGINDNSFLKVMYTVSDVDFNGRQGAFGLGNPVYKGGLISTQLSVRF